MRALAESVEEIFGTKAFVKSQSCCGIDYLKGRISVSLKR